MNIIKLYTTGVVDRLVLHDLGNLELIHPVSGLTITDFLTEREIINSQDLRDAIQNEYVYLLDEFNNMINDIASYVRTTSHSSLDNLQGGQPNEYYHLTSAQHSMLVAANDASTLHHHNNLYYTKAQSDSNYLSANTFHSVINTRGINNNGNITATTYFGDGSNLTGIAKGSNYDIQYNYNGNLSASTRFKWINDLYITGSTFISSGGLISNYVLVGDEISNPDKSTIYAETSIDGKNDVLRTFFNGGSDVNSAYITHSLINNTPIIRVIDMGNDPSFISFDTVRSLPLSPPNGTLQEPVYRNVFGSAGSILSGVTEGFSWKTNKGISGGTLHEIMSCSSRHLTIPIRPTSERPSPASNGMIAYNSTTNRFEGYENNQWVNLVPRLNELSGVIPVHSGGTNITSYSQGDMLYASSANVLSRLPRGLSGQTLMMNSSATAPEWQTTMLDTFFQYAINDATLNFTNTSFLQRLVITTPNLPTGLYRIGWSCEVACNNTNNSVYIQIRNASINAIYNDINIEPKDIINWYPAFGFTYTTLSGINTIEMLYRVNGATGSIRYARMEIWRVS